ncbi:family 16 glycosylhydrolase [Leptolyngbya cf. ectocarpi LEGE 11479]|uniref:Family 16 glycosylhydrolase n=1 Tax=Leptolyngbya cf. ectocarpi LEGE 11479 TaxID=1828722 RepID=A0A928ZTW3_LEPEC|nr:glycoside hydrolase family 16 protein [Leptolyngbya ectocarpi]MBE9067361.1 family 16 glycosylhydrolase [Leptolyngbya cf. ectocarpi LEGE 11479]
MKDVRLNIFSALTLLSILSSSTVAYGAVLFRDDFEGTGNVSADLWDLPQFPVPAPGPGESNPTFLGRTQLKLNERPAIVNGVAQLELNTFNPRNSNLGPGEIPSFFGSEIISTTTFSRKNGLAVEARTRLNAPDSLGTSTQRGLVAAMFLFDSTKINSNQFLFNEIDFEFLTNDVNNAEAGSPPRVLTNVFANDPPGRGDPAFINIDNLDLTEFNTFRIEWLPDKVRWFVNGNLIRTESASTGDLDVNIPETPLNLHLNLWAPAADFADAFDNSLQPAFSLATDQSFFYEIDFVQVEQLEAASVPESSTSFGVILLAGLIGLRKVCRQTE